VILDSIGIRCISLKLDTLTVLEIDAEYKLLFYEFGEYTLTQRSLVVLPLPLCHRSCFRIFNRNQMIEPYLQQRTCIL